MTLFLSHVHQDLRRARLTRRGATHKPSDVPRGTHKEYPRMVEVALPPIAPLSIRLDEALAQRKSATDGDAQKAMPLTQWSTLLGHALQRHKNSERRHYPSGGALFPVETYLISSAIEGYEPGIFHYNPTKHVLERLWDLPATTPIKSLARHPDTLPLSTLVVFTAVWKRSSAKYGDLAYLHALIEAGHMSENILLTATALGIPARPYAGFDDAALLELLDIHPDDEQPIHSITLCAPRA